MIDSMVITESPRHRQGVQAPGRTRRSASPRLKPTWWALGEQGIAARTPSHQPEALCRTPRFREVKRAVVYKNWQEGGGALPTEEKPSPPSSSPRTNPSVILRLPFPIRCSARTAPLDTRRSAPPTLRCDPHLRLRTLIDLHIWTSWSPNYRLGTLEATHLAGAPW